MNFPEIEHILRSLPHNDRYLTRYIKFIKSLQNQNIKSNVDKHHICPKAKMMFPEYSSPKKNPWNIIKLTKRQHYVAHMLLWKSYPSIGSMASAFFAMSNIRKERGEKYINSRMYESLRNDFLSSNAFKLRTCNKNMSNVWINKKLIKVPVDSEDYINSSSQFKGTLLAINKEGERIRVSVDEFKQREDLHGHTKGMTYAIDSDGNGIYVQKDDPRFHTGEIKGNNAGTITITDGKTNKRISPLEKIPRGWKKGMTKKSIKKSTWINNGSISKMLPFGDPIPPGFIKGRLFRK